MAHAGFSVSQADGGQRRITLTGQWSLRAVDNNFAELRGRLASFFGDPLAEWDLREVEQLDSAAAAMLLAGWGGRRCPHSLMSSLQAQLFSALENVETPHRRQPIDWFAPLAMLGTLAAGLISQMADFLGLFGGLVLEVFHLIRNPHEIPWKEISANIYKGGVMALPVTALVGFMIGIAMSYLMALQLSKFGADIFIVNILGLAVVRELGPILMAVLVAGRSGSAMTAQIGVMRVTEEIDALAAMGISRIQRLILPKLVGLTLIAPMLVFWTSLWALIGGMLSAKIELSLGYAFFLQRLAEVLSPVNLTLALFKGLLFGFLVTLVACHFGLRIKPNTESLSTSTTSSVVTAITIVILTDAVFAIMTREIGL